MSLPFMSEGRSFLSLLRMAQLWLTPVATWEMPEDAILGTEDWFRLFEPQQIKLFSGGLMKQLCSLPDCN